MDLRPIGIFDSGLGGLTCVKEIMKIMPKEDIIYFGDTGRVPYGTRSRETIVKYVRQDINFLKTFDIKSIIIACGTASSAALPMIEDEFDTEITGVVFPAAKKAADTTKSGKIGVIGTEGSIRSGKYKEELEKLNPDFHILSKACPLFVPLVENGYLNGKATHLIAEDYLLEMKKEKIDTLILGCTHYPLLSDIIRDVLGDGVTLIDSGAAAAEFAKERIEKRSLQAEREQGSCKFFVSDITESFSKQGGMFLNREITEQVKRINIENF